ncbi:MAG: N-formylglutamate amidohydrolase [Aquabacterium sp.]
MPFADEDVLVVHGPTQALCPIVLDSPHSGFRWPLGFDAVVSPLDLRDAEDCFIDELWRPAADRGVPLLAAQFPRTWIDVNRHAGDIDLDLIEGGVWPHEHRPSGKARIGKALIWRTLDDGRPIYARKLTVAEVAQRIDRFHRPYQEALAGLIDSAHRVHGRVVHLNCHSMNAVSGRMGEGGAGRPRADIVLGDRDGTTCAPALTALVRAFLSGRGYEVKVNDPFKGVELVRAFSNPDAGRHSLQVEVNKRLYLQDGRIERHGGFDRLQADLMDLLEVIDQGFARA